jgi:hypothetical protein
MNNTNRNMIPDNQEAPLPSFPKRGEYGLHVCEAVRFYITIMDDLAPEQIQILREHVAICPPCDAFLRFMQQTTHRVASLPESHPSARVDQAVMAAITAQKDDQALVGTQFITPNASHRRQPQLLGIPARRSRNSRLVAATLAISLAAMLLLALVGTLYFAGGFWSAPQQAFSLPANLTWNGNILYHTESELDAQGQLYQVDAWYDFATGDSHVETMMDNSLDVVAVGNSKTMLGLDMMHHVAQWGANQWNSNESVFNLNAMRQDLQTKTDVYVGTEQFHGQEVYRIRCSNGLTLLLNMQYKPVNILRGAVGPGTGAPVYNTVQLLPTSQVPGDMWNMSVPSGFKMGNLPKRP